MCAAGTSWVRPPVCQLATQFFVVDSSGTRHAVTATNETQVDIRAWSSILQKLTLEAARGVKALLDAGKGAEVVAEIARVSTEGRAPKQGPGVFALALCCRCALSTLHASPLSCELARIQHGPCPADAPCSSLLHLPCKLASLISCSWCPLCTAS